MRLEELQSDESARSQVDNAALIRIVLISLIIRLAVIPFVWGEWMQPYFLTHWEQGNVSRGLLAGHGFTSPFVSAQSSAVMPPVYPCIVAVLFSIFGIHTAASILATLSLNCLLSSLAVIPVYLVARNSFGTRVAWWAAWGWALSPYGIYFSAEWAWSTHLLILLLYWLIYLSQRLEQTNRLALWAGYGVLAGIAALTEPVSLTVGPVLALLAAFQLWKAGKRWLLPGIVAAACLTATISPWMVRNYVVFHRIIPIRDGMGLELALGNDGFAKHWIHAARHPNHDASELLAYNQGEIAYMDQKKQEATRWISAHPREYAWLYLRRAGYIWTGFWSFDREYLKSESMDPENVCFATTLTCLGFLGLRKAFRHRFTEALRYASVLFFFPMVYYFTHPQVYHFRPLDPLMVILIAYQLVKTPAASIDVTSEGVPEGEEVAVALS